MMGFMLLYCSAFFRSRHDLGLTLAAMKQQMIVLHRSCNHRHRRLTFLDKAFWILLRCWWPRWKEELLIVKLATVLKWHRMGFRLYWRWKSRSAGRPKIPRFLQRDRDGCYGAVFKARSEHCGTRNLIAPRRAPKFNAVAERLVRTIRRECLDHILVLGEAHLLRILREYAAFYNSQRPHQGIGQKTPLPKKGAIRKRGKIVTVSVLGGLQHYYERRAA